MLKKEKEQITLLKPGYAWDLLTTEEKQKYSRAYDVLKPHQVNSCVVCGKPFRFIRNNNIESNSAYLLPSNLHYHEACTCSNECWEYLKLLMC